MSWHQERPPGSGLGTSPGGQPVCPWAHVGGAGQVARDSWVASVSERPWLSLQTLCCPRNHHHAPAPFQRPEGLWQDELWALQRHHCGHLRPPSLGGLERGGSPSAAPHECPLPRFYPGASARLSGLGWGWGWARAHPHPTVCSGLWVGRGPWLPLETGRFWCCQRGWAGGQNQRGGGSAVATAAPGAWTLARKH